MASASPVTLEIRNKRAAGLGSPPNVTNGWYLNVIILAERRSRGAWGGNGADGRGGGTEEGEKGNGVAKSEHVCLAG